MELQKREVEILSRRAAIALSPVLFRKGNHAGYRGADSDQMKFYFGGLPEELRKALDESP
jgi:hypothetical protein